VLRLWPETIIFGLFPGECTLRRGRYIQRHACAIDADGPQLLSALRSTLESAEPFGRMARAEIYVSDKLARIALLPWQRNLESAAQIQAYGQACLEAHGVHVHGEWAMHAGFRHPDANGLAVALPADFVQELLEVLALAGLGLRSVMPVTAAAYWHDLNSIRSPASVVWLEEGVRLTALTYLRGRLRSLDVEPVLKTGGAAHQRLVSRIKMGDVSPQDIRCWSASEIPTHSTFLKEQFESAVVADIEGQQWG